MNPNGQNQRWSKWVWFVQPGRTLVRPFVDVKANLARFAGKAFGSVSQMRITQTGRGYLVELLTEGHPVHDPSYRQYMRENWERFFISGFGQGTTVKMTAKLMAGSRQDGTPSDQLLILPVLHDPALRKLRPMTGRTFQTKDGPHGKRTLQSV